MKIEEVKKYFDLGFSVEEVKKIMEGGGDEEPASDEPAEAGGSNPPDGEPEEGAKDAPAQESGSLSGINQEVEAWLKNIQKDISEEVKKMQKAYERFNILNINGEPEKVADGVDALASVINPPIYNEKGELINER